ncbi:MAG: ABC transporter permease [Planctomycetota bacterium]|nr:MAG: ABC transporter permease [Planctomycetota bacterium]
MRAAALLSRVGALLLTVLAVHAAAFLLARAARGGPFDQERETRPELRRALEQHYHLDEPLAAQYARSLWNLAHGDFGPSLRYRGVSVGEILAQSLPLSLALGAAALLFALLCGVPAGLWAATQRRRAPDTLVLLLTTLLLAVPSFVLAAAAVLAFSFTLGWLPPAGTGSPAHLILPCLCLGLPVAAQIARLTRSGALEILHSDAVRAARAKGLPRARLLRRHVLRPALVPVVAFLGPAAAGLLTGSLVIEQVFALPGLGAHFVQAALNRDYTLALGATVTYTLLLGLCTLAADLLLARLDPRTEALS